MVLFCCLFPPHHPPGPTQISSLSGGFLRRNVAKILPVHPPKILPSEGDSSKERRTNTRSSPPKISLESPLNGSRNGDNLSIKSLYFARITLIFPGFLPRAIPLQGQLAGRMQGEMSGNVCCALKGWTLGSS